MKKGEKSDFIAIGSTLSLMPRQCENCGLKEQDSPNMIFWKSGLCSNCNCELLANEIREVVRQSTESLSISTKERIEMMRGFLETQEMLVDKIVKLEKLLKEKKK